MSISISISIYICIYFTPPPNLPHPPPSQAHTRILTQPHSHTPVSKNQTHSHKKYADFHSLSMQPTGCHASSVSQKNKHTHTSSIHTPKKTNRLLQRLHAATGSHGPSTCKEAQVFFSYCPRNSEIAAKYGAAAGCVFLCVSATHDNTLQHTAIHRNHHCNTLQH